MTIICSVEHICASDRFDQIGQSIFLDFGCVIVDFFGAKPCFSVFCLLKKLVSMTIKMRTIKKFLSPFFFSYLESL